MSLKRAVQVYLVYQRSIRQSTELTSGYERHRDKIYPRILSADRYFRSNYDGLTTVLLTRRLEPTDKDGKWIEPAMLDMMLHNKRVMKRVRKSLNYQLRGLDFEYMRVTAPTETAATPHEHRYLWVDDPENRVTVEHIKPALEDHLAYCANARREHHPVVPSGEEGAITIRHTHPLVDFEYTRGDDIRHTQGAQYLASQLAHLHLGEKFNPDTADPLLTLLEGGAIAWATPSTWFGTSRGVPKLGER